MVKKTKLSDFRNFRKGGIIGINIDENDDLIGARLTTGEDEIVLITQNAQSFDLPRLSYAIKDEQLEVSEELN